jgi:hypothetical protein
LLKSLAPARASGLTTALVFAAVALPPSAVQSGHEVPYYPSFYPQEIRIEPLDAETAAAEFVKPVDPLNVYLGAAPRFAGAAPAHLKSVVSLSSLIVASVNPQSQRLQSRDARCMATRAAPSALAKQSDLVAHRYPVTPYHDDYIAHADLAGAANARDDREGASLTFRTRDIAGVSLLAADARTHASEWDLRLDEVPLAELLLKAGVGIGAWLAPPWAKQGWFQAYRLLRPALADPSARERADAAYARLTAGEFRDATERVALERDLVAALTAACEHAVVGYRLRREYYHDDFSNGIENIVADSQSGFNSPVFMRTVKLKDFPWNGWLRVGIAARPAAALNPVAGFTDAPGRLLWSIVGDDAFLPIPSSGRWVQNRAEIQPDDDDSQRKQSMRIPADAMMPQPVTGMLVAVGDGKGAMARMTFRVSASAFHDGTEMTSADLFYPYALAIRWGSGDSKSATFDPEIAAATQLMRERLRAVRVVKVEERTLQLADLTFHYRSPVVEVYLDDLSSDEDERALVAPPWSSVPWHVLALMEAAVERDLGAFSRTEAARRGRPWLELVRDPAQREKLAALVQEFAATGYRPAALAGLVTPEDAKARWRALAKFVAANGHLLVTNGPYRLASATPEAIVLNVVREFTYPIGIGQFDPFAYPPRVLITSVARAGDRIMVTADVEFAIKQQRDRRIVRAPVKRDTLRDTVPLRPVARYVIVGENGKVAAAGAARWQPDGRFAAALPAALAPGAYTFLTAIAIDGNAVDPAIGRLDFRSDGSTQ